ncbi:hypothetical protein [Streptomyces sp. NPDC048202]|uniref:hypothetical protein n=1 Tax=Streptomyces sp. NPDC048202 TaxID=3365514 RepID=UPI0037204B8E
MADGFIRWYKESGSASSFPGQVRILHRYNVFIAHPETRVTTLISVDGEDIPVDLERLSWLIESRVAPVNMNWWLSPNVNVVDEFSFEPYGCEIQTFWLDGLDFEEIEMLRSSVVAAAQEAATPTRALVCDVHGNTDAESWDSVLLYEGAEIPGSVDALMVGPHLAERILSMSNAHDLRNVEVL